MTQSANHSPSFRGGFSLIELLIVTAIVAIISMSITPVYVSVMNGVRLRNARNDIMAAIRFAQEMAVRESREYRVYFNNRENQYRVMRLAGVEDNEKVFEEAESLVGGTQTLPEYLALDRIDARRDPETREHYISCLPNGASNQATIRFRDTRLRGTRFDIEVAGPMGKVSMKERR